MQPVTGFHVSSVQSILEGMVLGNWIYLPEESRKSCIAIGLSEILSVPYAIGYPQLSL